MHWLIIRLSSGGKHEKNPQTAQKNTSEKALVYLREQIINGNLTPQEKLVESVIAQTLGISRGPVRDALKQLAVEGLVNYQPNKGGSVSLLSPRDAYEVFFLRGSLEKLALQKSGCHINDCGIFIMETAIDEIQTASESNNTLQAVHADEKFHRQIMGLSQSQHLGQVSLRVNIQQKNLLALHRQSSTEIVHCGTFPNTALLVGNSNDLCFCHLGFLLI